LGSGLGIRQMSFISSAKQHTMNTRAKQIANGMRRAKLKESNSAIPIDFMFVVF
jgi:hypothetical protein